MSEVTLAGEVKDWLTSLGIVIGGGWAMWRFGRSEWLRRRAEIPTLEGNSSTPDIWALGDDRVAVSLRWSWRNAGTRRALCCGSFQGAFQDLEGSYSG
jgi:hypothetical protein